MKMAETFKIILPFIQLSHLPMPHKSKNQPWRQTSLVYVLCIRIEVSTNNLRNGKGNHGGNKFVQKAFFL